LNSRGRRACPPAPKLAYPFLLPALGCRSCDGDMSFTTPIDQAIDLPCAVRWLVALRRLHAQDRSLAAGECVGDPLTVAVACLLGQLVRI
jgi:hypothetical protein